MQRTISQSEVPAALADILPRVFAYTTTAGVPMVGPPFTRYLEMTRGSMTIQAGIPVAGPATSKDDIEAIELPGGDVVVAVHVGPYEGLAETYGKMEAHLREQGRKPADAWEIDLTDPAEVPDPAEWQTQIVMRVG